MDSATIVAELLGSSPVLGASNEPLLHSAAAAGVLGFNISLCVCVCFPVASFAMRPDRSVALEGCNFRVATQCVRMWHPRLL